MDPHHNFFKKCDVGVVWVWCWCGVGVVFVWCWCGVGVVWLHHTNTTLFEKKLWCWCGVVVVLVWCGCGLGEGCQLCATVQIAAVSRSCFYQIHQLRVVRQSLTNDPLRALVQANLRLLEYRNGWGSQTKRLQSEQNTSARLVSAARCATILHCCVLLVAD